MFYILWIQPDTDGQNTWTLRDGEDAMQEFVSDLVTTGQANLDEIKVFPANAEIG